MATRREFIRQIGILLSSLTVTYCTPLPRQDDSAHARLRKCWLDLKEVETKFQTDYRGGQEASDRLRIDHRAALDKLVEAGELDASSAEHVQLIFDEAVYHIERSMSTCYESIPMPDYLPAARGQLMRQTDLLAEMTAEGDLDPQTVAQAQAALERDTAFLNLSEADRKALYDDLAAGTTYPRFEELDLEITPPAAKATQFLVKVLLREQE
jgi:hypothetical protein